MARKSKKSPGELPQGQETWCFAVRKLRAWILSEEEEPLRPYIMITVNLEAGIQNLQAGKKPGIQEVQESLFTAMLNPPKEMKIPPHRPARILIEDRELVRALTPALQEIGIETRYRAWDQMDALVKDLELELNEGQPEIPGLLSQPKVTARQVAGLFAGAAAFYRAAPWVQLANEDVLAIQVPPQNKPYFAIVMGQGGVEYGLASYHRWEDVERQFLTYDSAAAISPGGQHSLLFNPVDEIPFDDLDAIEKYGWELVGPEAYPFPVVFLPPDKVQRPGRDELLWYEAALHAIPVFVRDYLNRDPSGEIRPVEASIPVTTSTGALQVRIKYPAGDLPVTRQPAFSSASLEPGPLPFPFDRRSLEGEMARMAASLSEGSTGSELEKAQEIMYQAWEQRNRKKRIALARKALAVSKDCSDAYVLLAEEESSTSRALEYFQEGIRAGERALGQDYFSENAGDFWALLETRPYMRAMEGAASCLWQLGRKEEALQTYREMLRLNPNDNQGIRYVLVELLLELRQERDLEKLLRQYKGDWTSVWAYTQALLAFRKGGANEKARQALQTALGQNPFVPAYLTGKKRIPNRLPDYIGIGDEDEAVSYAANHLNHWRQTPGAVEWLQELSSPPPANTPKNPVLGKSKKNRQ